MSGMRGKMGCLLASALALGLILASAAAAADPDLVGWWTLDEGSGTATHDSSGNQNLGTLHGPQWAVGKIGGALHFVGATDYVEVPDSASLDITDTITIAAWVLREVDTGTWDRIVAKSDASIYDYWLQITSADSVGGGIRDAANTVHHIDTTAGPSIPLNQWTHLAFVYDGTSLLGYIDGQVVKSVNIGTFKMMVSTRPLWFRRLQNAYSFQGLIDEICIFRRALTPAEIQKLMTGLADQAAAAEPSPEDEAVDVPRDAALSWTPGSYPATHDVYLGTTFADVNTAARAGSQSVLVSQGQTAATFVPPAPFAFGQTYYWRIDEVNSTPDHTIFPGEVWSFTTEPYAYPIAEVTATASSYQPGMEPEHTVDGSGLTDGLHGTDGMTMWLSTGAGPNWIQYRFDQVYKLYDLKVWNSNQLIEPFLGFGAKEVRIEYSTDGSAWTVLANVPPFGRAAGTPGSATDTTIDFGGVDAEFVKLTINSTWGGLPTAGLAEVRFSYIPLQARLPQPAPAATGVSVDTDLNWRPGRLAASHTVYFATDPDAVAQGTVAAQTPTQHRLTPGPLNFGTTYYWRVDEVNGVTYPGQVWDFTTQEFAAIDDFESYTDQAGEEVFLAWIDGFTNGLSGSMVGYLTATNGTFGETRIVHGGRQSMPFEYNNVKTPFYSEAERTFDTPQNWTGHGADTLSVWFRGRPAAFMDQGNNTYLVSGSGADIWGSADQFRFVYKQLNGDGSIALRVDRIDNTNTWAKAGPMIRETLNAGSRNAFIAVTPGQGVSAQWRDATDGPSANSQTAGLAAPYWVRLTRTGNVIKAERSADGQTWTQQGTNTTVLMATSVYIGIAVTSHDATLTAVAQVSHVATTGTVTGPWQPVAIGMAMPANDPASLYLTVQDKAGKKTTVVHPDPAASTAAAWTPWRIPLGDLTAAGVNPAAVQKLTLGVGNPASPKAGAAGMLYFDDLGYGHPAR